MGRIFIAEVFKREDGWGSKGEKEVSEIARSKKSM